MPLSRCLVVVKFILAASVGAQVVPAAATPVARPFPLAVTADDGARGLQLRSLGDAIDALLPLSRVTLAGVPRPGLAPLDVELERVPIASVGGVVAVDGVPQPGVRLDDGLSLWSGRVAGAPDSEVFLAFSRWGSRGWVRAEGGLWHLLAQPGAGGDWSDAGAILIGDRALRDLGAVPHAVCLAGSAAQPGAPALPRTASAAATVPVLPLLEARLGVETDFQYFLLFGNVNAAQTYAASLLGAVSSRYREQVGVILTVPYFGLHTLVNDGWVTQETGGGSLDLLYEFQSAWDDGAAPVSANCYQFLSAAPLGGGIAFLPGLCDPDYDFSVAADIGAVTPFPIAVGPLNWDFMVSAHELGHNFDALHTHDYCPPLDQCAPSGWFGPCQLMQVCTNQGTLMSYCHLCDGGQLNVTTLFHPQSVADMRAYAASSCLLPFKGVLVQDLGYALAGAGPAPTMTVTFTATPDTLHLDSAGAGPLSPGMLFVSMNLVLMPFKGGTLVPSPQMLVPVVATLAGKAEVPLLADGSLPTGLQLYAQAWFKQGLSLYAATNGVAFEIITP